MKFSRLKLRVGAFLFLCWIQFADSTLILTSMLLAAKTGMLLGKMGVGGMMMMLLAANQYNHNHPETYRKARVIRSLEDDLHELHLIKRDNATNHTQTFGDEETTNRMVRQIDAALDTFTCIPKFICGINSEPPSKKTTLLNDYGHLVKLMFADDDDDDEGDITTLARDDEELGLALEEDEKFQDELHDKLIDEDPSLLPFVLKDLVKKKKNKDKKNNRHGLDSSDGIPMMPESYPYPRPPPNPYRLRPRPPPPKPQGFSPLSVLTSFLPKIETSLGSKPDDNDFDRDPFFSGFRSMKAIEELVQNNTSEEFKEFSLVDTEEYGENKPLTGDKRLLFLERKARELEKAVDALDKYRIAEEVGKKTKSKKDCAQIYKKCPYSWNEITKMVDNMRTVVKQNPTYSSIMKGVGSSGKSESLSVKNSDGTLITTGMNTGLTTVMHDLGNGNMVEISMKLLPKSQSTGPITTIDLPSFGSKLEDTHTELKSTDLKTSPAVEMVIPENSGVSDEELNAAALAFQTKNANNKRKIKRKKQNPKPLEDFPVVNKEIFKESVVDDDDEAADQFPVIIDNKTSMKSNRRKKNKKSKKKKNKQGDLHNKRKVTNEEEDYERTLPNGNDKSRRQGQPAKSSPYGSRVKSSSHNYNLEYAPRRPPPPGPVPSRPPLHRQRKRPILIPLNRRGSIISRRPKSDFVNSEQD